MSYRCVYDPVALNEYKDAISWYIERSELAAEGFVKEVKDQIAVICNDPFRFRNTYKNYREISLKRYPYYIVYLVDEAKKNIIVSSVYHHKRNPQKKYKK
jgi:plasmid stabilization system protein ParE